MTETVLLIVPFFSVTRCEPGLTDKCTIGEGPSDRPLSSTSSQKGLHTIVKKPGSPPPAGTAEAVAAGGVVVAAVGVFVFPAGAAVAGGAVVACACSVGVAGAVGAGVGAGVGVAAGVVAAGTTALGATTTSAFVGTGA